MVDGSEVVESYNLLKREDEEEQTLLNREQMLAEYASAVLATRGELVFCRRGMYGGREGLIGSSTPGVLLTQGTIPMKQEDQIYFALRHKPVESSSPIVELLALTSDKPADVQELDRGKVIMSFESGRVQLPSRKTIENGHLKAAEVLIRCIKDETDPLDARVEQLHLPRVENRIAVSDRQIFNLRHDEELPRRLLLAGPGGRLSMENLLGA